MDEYVNKKPLIITIVVATILIIMLGIQMRTPKNVKKEIPEETSETIIKLNMNEYADIIIKKVALMNSDWSNLPLSDNFKNKYNNEDGIIKDHSITEIAVNGNPEKTNIEKQQVTLMVYHGYRIDDYYFKYILNDNDELDDVQLIKTEVVQYDEGLHPTLAKEPKYVNEKNYAKEIAYLSSPGVPLYATNGDYDFVETTDNFKKKYKDGFGDESEFEYVESIISYEEISNWNDKLIYFYKRGKNTDGTEDFIKYYKIKFRLDNIGCVDDVDVNVVPEFEIDKLFGISPFDEE